MSFHEPAYFMQTIARTGSMMPLIAPGAKIILDMSPKQSYKAGDIAAYLGYGGNIVVHRILGAALTPSGRKQYLLKGDHNKGLDRYIDEKHLLGKVQKIVYPSYDIDLATFLSSSVAPLIAYCGTITSAHRWFYTVERITVSCLTLILILWARWKFLYRGKN